LKFSLHITFAILIGDLKDVTKRRESRNIFFFCKYKLSQALRSKIGVQIFCENFFDDFAFGIYPSPVSTIFNLKKPSFFPDDFPLRKKTFFFPR